MADNRRNNISSIAPQQAAKPATPTFQDQLDAIPGFDEKKIPPEFICPVSQTVMDDPITLSKSGKTYDRKSLIEYVDKRPKKPNSSTTTFRCPQTRVRISISELKNPTHTSMRNLISDYVENEKKKALKTEEQPKSATTTEPTSSDRTTEKHSFYSNPSSNALFTNQSANRTNMLLNFVARGDIQKVTSILELHPQLLTCKGTVYDPAKRNLVERTALQIALGEQDVAMYTMIADHFEKLPNWQTEMAKQFNEQFPNGMQAKKSYIHEFKNLAVIITNDKSIKFLDNEIQMNSATMNAIKEFKSRYAPSSTNEFKEGLYFDPQMLVDVLSVYHDKFYSFQNWSQRSLYCCQVFGLVQSWLPANIAQLFCEPNNFYEIMLGRGKVEIRPTLKLNDKRNFFASEIGENHFIFQGEPRTLTDPAFEKLGENANKIETYFDQKRQFLKILCKYFKKQSVDVSAKDSTRPSKPQS